MFELQFVRIEVEVTMPKLLKLTAFAFVFGCASVNQVSDITFKNEIKYREPAESGGGGYNLSIDKNTIERLIAKAASNMRSTLTQLAGKVSSNDDSAVIQFFNFMTDQRNVISVNIDQAHGINSNCVTPGGVPMQVTVVEPSPHSPICISRSPLAHAPPDQLDKRITALMAWGLAYQQGVNERDADKIAIFVMLNY